MAQDTFSSDERARRDEVKLLLYLETRCVDHDGRINTVNLNDDDRKILKRWRKSGFVTTGRIQWSDIVGGECLWCRLSDEAWSVAHVERKKRAERCFNSRTYHTTDER